jgi:LacI family transcriptional regulator
MTGTGTGQAPTESNRPTLRQVAELAGVSLKTASRVFNGEQYVAPETAARVRDVAERLGFRPNTIARELRAGARSALVGLIIGDVANPFYARIARGAERMLRDAGLRLISASSDEDPGLERALVSDLLERRVSALLIVSCESDHGYLSAELALGTALVFLDRSPRDIDADSVVLDNHGGVTAAVRHLVERGHRRIAFVGDLSRLPTHLERVAAYEEGLAEAGIAEADRRTYARDGAHDADAAEAEVRALLELAEPPTALITANNRITTGALRALRGVDGPPALIGFDDFDLADLLDVTVIAHDPVRMGELGVELLLDRLSGREGPTRRVLMPTRLLARGSGERATRL